MSKQHPWEGSIAISATKGHEYGAVIYRPPLTVEEAARIAGRALSASAIGLRAVKINGEPATVQVFPMDYFGSSRRNRAEVRHKQFRQFVHDEVTQVVPERTPLLGPGDDVALGPKADTLFTNMQAAHRKTLPGVNAGIRHGVGSGVPSLAALEEAGILDRSTITR